MHSGNFTIAPGYQTNPTDIMVFIVSGLGHYFNIKDVIKNKDGSCSIICYTDNFIIPSFVKNKINIKIKSAGISYNDIEDDFKDTPKRFLVTLDIERSWAVLTWFMFILGFFTWGIPWIVSWVSYKAEKFFVECNVASVLGHIDEKFNII